MKKLLPTSLLLAPFCLTVMAGCSRQPESYTASFEPNLVQAMKYQIKEDMPKGVAVQASGDAKWLVDGMFGTPDEPQLPELLKEGDFAGLVSMARLEQASGEIGEGKGIYRQHCVSCHGVTGNGRGENSAIVDPYPRDYRHGVFKFKSTKRNAKPTREDLARSIRDGIIGTSMKKIPELTEDNIQALVDYVIYLSIRGEIERALIDDGFAELSLDDGDRIFDIEFAASLEGDGRAKVEADIKAWEEAGEPEEISEDVPDPRAELAKKLDDHDYAFEIADELLEEFAEEWLEAEDDVIEVPEAPSSIPVANSHAEFVSLSQGDQAKSLAASVKRGQELFVGKIASCSKCHGEQGKGNGTTTDYDDWTKDWTVRAGLKPEDTEALIPLMARGALPPKNAIPRNFEEGLFRGGDRAEDLYRRIHQGIAGSPMPASTFVPGEFEEDDIWHLINFVRSLQKASDQPETPVDDKPGSVAKL